jgi:hypothetical protein
MRQNRTPRNGLGITDWALLPGEILRTGLDVPGILFAGWWERQPPELSEFGAFANGWPPESATFKYSLESLAELGGKGFQAFAYVRILRYPEDSWMQVIAKSLSFFTDRGAAIAWAGGYECFVRYMAGGKLLGCYAAFTPKGGLACRGGLDEPLRYLDEDPRIIDQLHRQVRNSQINP